MPAVPLLQPEAPDSSLARVVELTNAERRKAGAPPLAPDDRLGLAARRYAAALAGGACFAHDCGPVPELGARVGATGYAWARLGENLAAGQRTPEEVVAAWLASPGHRANLLDPAVTELGLGRADGGPYGVCWVQVLAAPPASAPAPGAAPGAAPAPASGDGVDSRVAAAASRRPRRVVGRARGAAWRARRLGRARVTGFTAAPPAGTYAGQRGERGRRARVEGASNGWQGAT